ncbi:hypothetical protein KCU61_g91, partial [Aureobasidium melanogenum]
LLTITHTVSAVNGVLHWFDKWWLDISDTRNFRLGRKAAAEDPLGNVTCRLCMWGSWMWGPMVPITAECFQRTNLLLFDVDLVVPSFLLSR